MGQESLRIAATAVKKRSRRAPGCFPSDRRRKRRSSS